MPEFHYKAKALSGEVITGVAIAKDEEELAKNLSRESYNLVSAAIKEKGEGGIRINISFGKKVSLVEKMMFTRYLAVMLGAGFPFDRALNVLAEQSKNKYFKEIILEIVERIIKGETFSSSLEKYPNIFNELYANMIKIGEEAGNLEEVLIILADQMEKDYKLLAKIKAAMVYPAIILVVMILIGIAMMIMVIPKFSEMFEKMNLELPFTTRIIIGLGDFISNYWYLLPIIIFIFIFGLQRMKDVKKGKKIFDWFSLYMPIAGSLNIKINTARTARILSSLLASGVPIVKSLEILSNTLASTYYKNAINSAVRDIQKGKTLKDCLSSYKKIYSFLLIQMIEVGEKTGKLSDILEKLAEFYEEEVDNDAKNLSSVIEPVLMVVIGAAVGVFAVSIIQPLYSMMGSL